MRLSITHTYDGDLEAYLEHPDGTSVELFNNVGGAGDNFADTVFDDDCATSIASGTAPFEGCYHPEGLLSALNGKPAAGTWRLRVYDHGGLDVGSVTSWCLRLTTSGCAPPNPPTGGTAAAVSLTEITWGWTRAAAASGETYLAYDTSTDGTLQWTSSSEASSYTESGLSANTLYGSGGLGRYLATYTGCESATRLPLPARYTLAGPPSYGNNVTCDKSTGVWYPKDTCFVFTNPAGFGTGGQYKVSKFKYAWDTSPAYVWTGSESDWSGGDLSLCPSLTGSYYLHLQSCNGDGLANPASLDLGPYKADTNPPSAPAVTDDGAFQLDSTQLHAAWTPSTDAESGMCGGYEYAIGASPTDPESGQIVPWTSAGAATEATAIGLSLQYGVVYYWHVRATDCAGNISIGTSDGITAVQTPTSSIAAAKILPDGSPVGLASRVVTAALGSAFYIQDPDGAAGIRVEPGVAPAGLRRGDLVDIGGKIKTSPDGERFIDGCIYGTGGTHAVLPVGMTNSSLGGADWNYDAGTGAGQKGIAGAIGLNNIGLLVRVWGNVTGSGDTATQSWGLGADPGWAREGQWAYGVPTGSGGASHGKPDPSSGHTGGSVFGVNLSGDYSLTTGGPWYLTAGPIDCAGWSNTQLRFWRWLNTDYQPYVYATLQVSSDGSSWTTIFSNGSSATTATAWTQYTYDISSVADGSPTVYVRWGYQIASGAWAYSGWNIDDIELAGQQESHTITIDDGSGADVTVIYPEGEAVPAGGSFAVVTGISSCIRDPGGDLHRLVLAVPWP